MKASSEVNGSDAINAAKPEDRFATSEIATMTSAEMITLSV